MKVEHKSGVDRDEHPASMPRRQARTALLSLLLLSCPAPFLYYRLLDQGIEAVRYPWGLLPAHFLFLRYFGQLSGCFPVAIAAALLWSFFRPAHTRQLLTLSTVALLIFAVAFAAYAIALLGLLLRMPAA